MSIPQICPSCGNHVSTAHAADCCYGTPQYAHIGWPSYSLADSSNCWTGPELQSASDGILTMGIPKLPTIQGLGDTASAIRRLLDYLNEEPEEVKPQEPSLSEAFTSHAVLLLTKRSEELRREACGISLVESRAKRNFAADILDGLISELTE